MKILVDRNIEINSVTHRTVLNPQIVNWGDRVVTIDVAKRQAHPPRPDEHFRLEQLPYVASMAALARANRIQLFTSFELSMERGRQLGRDRGFLGLDLLSEIEIGNVPSPVPRIIAVGGHGQNVGVTEEEQMRFFRSIKHARFTEIRDVLGDAHIDDAFHFWTAEAAGLDAVVTMDRRFSNVAMRCGEKLQSSVVVLTPKALCDGLGEGPTNIDA